MTKFFSKIFFFITAALLLSLGGCVNDHCLLPTNPIEDMGGDRNILLRIAQQQPVTRGVSRPIPFTGELLKFNTGDLYLVNSAGIIIKHFTIVERSGAFTDLDNGIINRGDFDFNNSTNTDVLIIPNAPAATRSIVMVGNTPGNNIAGSVNVVGQRILPIISQYDAWNVNLFGSGTLTHVENNDWETFIYFAPGVARLEIGSIVGMGSIDKFTIAGIFMDNFYTQSPVNGTIRTELWTGGTEPNSFELGAHHFTETSNNALFDLPNLAGNAANNRTVYPRPGEDSTWVDRHGVMHTRSFVWGYQLFAQTNPNLPATPMPRLILRLRDVRLLGETEPLADYRFVTIREFIDNCTPFQGMRAGEVYHVPAVVFDEHDLGLIPNDPLRLHVTPTQMDFTAATNGGGTQTATVTTNIPTGWTVISDQPWVSVPTGIQRGEMLTVDVTQANTGTEPRFAILTVTAGALTETITVTQDAGVPPTLTVTPPALVFTNAANGGGAQAVTVTTNQPNWTVAVVGTHPDWLGALPAGNQTGTSFNVSVIQQNSGANPRPMVTLRVTAGGITEDVLVTQEGTNATVTARFDLVGAFWRNVQRGERLIRLRQANNNAWTAIATEPWIQLCGESFTFPNETGAAIVRADTPLLPAVDAGMGSAITGTGNAIYFRIGLRSTLPAGAMPRYGQVIVMHNNNTVSHIIWVRQGEVADYVMHRIDDNRPAARRFSPLNLTVPSGANGRPNNALLNTNLALRGGGFVWYPTQTGAFFMWAGSHTRRAFAPVGGFGATWGTHITGNWGTPNNLGNTHEACPAGFRRPNDGRISGTTFVPNGEARPNSEIRQSLFLNPPPAEHLNPLPNDITNSVWGFYADGFFDRRTVTNATGGGATGAAANTVAANTNYIAHRGRLFFNPRNNASLFFPASGVREGGSLNHVGSWGWYWSSTQGAGGVDGVGSGGRAWVLRTGSNAAGLGNGGHRPDGIPVRCVAE